MENTSTITSAGQRESLMTQMTQNNQVPIRQQQQGFYQVSASGTSLVSNTYDKTGEVSIAQIQNTGQTGFDQMY